MRRGGAPRIGLGARLRHDPVRRLRQLLALACLVMAAASAAHSALPAPRPTAARPAVSAAPGQRVVPVQVTGGDVRSYVDVGDTVELLAGDSGATALTASTAPEQVLAERATVLAIRHQGADTAVAGQSGWQLVVAVDETSARRLAAHSGTPALAVVGTR